MIKMIELYGIAHCTTVKKARAWLDEHQCDYTFHDFKKSPPSAQWLSGCLQQVDLGTLLNKRGTTWRNLSPEQQAQADTLDGAIALMCAQPSLIKRPVLIDRAQILVGFTPDGYANTLQAA